MGAAERSSRIHQVFLQVVSRPEVERTSWLDRLCDGDERLRREVQSLLGGDQQASAEGFLGRAAFSPNTPTFTVRNEDALTGTRLGPYVLGELVGEGGMGQVYRAVRGADYHQEVAVKVIRGSLADDECRRRFQTERQTLATLNHPHIARLIDGGTTPQGLPYLVMDYVAGDPLDRHCDRNALPTFQRVALLRDVCLAVHHAHERGVVHRDLKPGNVLVTADGQPRVLDFGLAKVFSAETTAVVEPTRAGVVLGTPGYMAPEQATAEPSAVGPAADVYGLGAVLYHLLTGRPPFRGNTVLETLDMVRNDEPVPPRTLQPRLPRDLDTMCLKCLHKDPGRRYATAAELADELGRVLAGEPIRGRPVGRAEHLGRWARRHPREAVLVAAMVLLAVAAFGGVTSLWLLAEARGEAARNQSQRAEELLAKADQVVEDYFTRVSDDARLKSPELLPLRRELVGAARDHYLDIVRRAEGDSNIDQQLATSYSRLSQIHHTRGDRKEALAAARQALVIRLRLVEAEPTSVLHCDKLAISYENVAAFLDDEELPQSIELTRAGLALRESLAREFPDDPKRHYDLLSSYYNLGHMLDYLGQTEEAITWLRRACAEGDWLMRALPHDNGYLHHRALCRDRLGYVLMAGQPDEAEQLYRDALDDRREIVRREPLRHDQIALMQGTLDRLASFLEEHGKAVLAVPLREQACETVCRSAEAAALADPRQLALERSLMEGRFKQGRLAVSLKDGVAARTAFREVLRLGDRLARAKGNDVQVRRMVGYACLRLARDGGQTDEAVPLLERVREQLGPVVEESPEDAESREWLAEARAELVRIRGGKGASRD